MPETYSFRQMMLPYCLEQQEDGSYLVLNRAYKTLGTPQMRTWQGDVQREPFKIVFERALSEQDARRMDCCGRGDVKNIFLYNDGCIPTQSAKHYAAYMKRLGYLLKRQVYAADDHT